MARLGLAVGGLVLIGAGIAVATGWWSTTATEASADIPVAVRHVQINNNSGDVTIRTADVQTTTIRQTFRYRWGAPDDAYSMQGDRLSLNDCGRMCRVDYDVLVPRGVVVAGELDSGSLVAENIATANVQADSGNITIRNATGSIEARADSGDVDLSSVAQQVVVAADSGNIRGEGLRGTVDATAQSGDISLKLDVAANVRAHADSGNIDLNVPAASYRTQGTSDSGNRVINVTTDPNAPVLLDLSTDSGDVRVAAQ